MRSENENTKWNLENLLDKKEGSKKNKSFG